MGVARLCLLLCVCVAATSVVHGDYAYHPELNYYDQTVTFCVSHFLEDGEHAWVAGVNPPYDPGMVVIFRTTDGGESWERIDTPLQGVPREVDFVDASNGWLITTELDCPMRTSDGGRTWAPQNCEGGWANKKMWDLQMLSNSEGYGSGEADGMGAFFEYDGTIWHAIPAGPECTITLHTMDARDSTHMWAIGTGRADTRAWGRTGSDEIQTLDVGIFPCAWSLHFYDRNHGWIGAGETIVHTTDGGLTWEEQDVWTLQAIRDVHFTSPTEGRACTNSGDLLTTSNGGDTWEIREITSGSLNDIDRWHDKWQITGAQGLFAWTDEEPAQPLPRTRIAPREPNPNARPWRLLESLEEVRGGALIDRGCFLGDERIWLAAHEAGQACVIFTRDAGITWERVEVSLPNQTVHDIEFVDAANGWLTCTGNPAIWQTTDGGRTWKPQLSQPAWAPAGRVTDLHMLNSAVGFGAYVGPGVGSKLIMWSPQAHRWVNRGTGIEDEFLKLWVRDAGHLWLVKNASVGWRSMGEMRFQPMSMVGPGSIDCIFSRDGIWGWMGGHRRIMRTTNGGASWEDQTVKLNHSDSLVNGIFFRDHQQGCAVSNMGDILITDDGGVKWVQTAPTRTNSIDLTSLRDVAWFNGAWTVVGARGVYRDTSDEPPQLVLAAGSVAAMLRATEPVAPQLQWYGDGPWRSRGQEINQPTAGRVDHFRVMYTDRNGDAPEEVVLVITDPIGETERRQMYPRHLGSFLSGKGYERAYGWARQGTYHYHFEATDSTGRAATGPATAEQTVSVGAGR